jgi:hypothetical protein
MIIVSSIMSVFSIFNNAGPLFVSSVISLLMSVSCTISAAYGCSLSISSTSVGGSETATVFGF